MFKRYLKNVLLQAAVERKLGVIGEALNRCKKELPDIHITDMDRIIGTRNRIIHAYDAIDNAMIWGIVIDHLPVLRKEVEEILSND